MLSLNLCRSCVRENWFVEVRLIFHVGVFKDTSRRSLSVRPFRSGFVFYLVVSTTCVACSVASCSVTENPNAGRSMPLRSASP